MAFLNDIVFANFVVLIVGLLALLGLPTHGTPMHEYLNVAEQGNLRESNDASFSYEV